MQLVFDDFASSVFPHQPSDFIEWIVRFERWQYGDTASTLATGMVFSDLPSDDVWAVFFDEQGQVIKAQSPMDRELGARPVEFPDMIPSRSR